MLVIVTMMIIRPRSLLQHKNQTYTKRKKMKGRETHHQNLRHQTQRVLPPQKFQSRKMLLVKARDQLVDIKNDPDDTVPVSVLNYIT